MAYRNTVAIIGAATTLGAMVAKGICAGCRLILADDGREQLAMLQSDIQQLNSCHEVEILHCCKEASWEADVIVLAVLPGEQSAAALKMKEVATGKTVISITLPGSKEALQQLLPHAKVVHVLMNAGMDRVSNPADAIGAMVEGSDDEAIATTLALFKPPRFNLINPSSYSFI